MIEALAFALKYFGLISDVVQEGITITPEIVALIKNGYDVINKVFDENRPPTDAEIAELSAQEEYWRNRLHSDDDLTDK